jgi:hypothetical protein
MVRKCKFCKFYVEKIPFDVKRTYTVIGRCRRNAPKATEGYPVTFPGEWCGQFKIDENKI